MRDVNFAIVDVAYEGSNAMNPNLEGLIFADDQAGFLAGVIAGGVASELSKKVGVIGGWPIPPVKRFINGFAGGVEYACSGCSTTIIYCPFGGAAEATTGLSCPGEFADVAFGVGVAQHLIGLGVDVIFGAGGLTGSAGITYAAAPQGTTISITGATSYNAEKTMASAPYVVGVDKDEWYTTFGSGSTPGADKLITSALKKVDVGVSLAISNYFAGTGSGSNVLLDASNGGVGFAPAHSAVVVTSAISASAAAVFDRMAAGTFNTYVDSNGDMLPQGLLWEYNSFGTIITHECGLEACLAESEFLAEEIQSAACSGSYSHKVTLVLDGGNIDDGTFNQLAYEGAAAACTEAASCCLEVDRVDDDTEVAETKFFCELEYAATDSDLTIGVGFLHEQSVHRAAYCASVCSERAHSRAEA